MSRGAPWRGFDYTTGQEVTKDRDDWRALIAKSARAERIGGDPLPDR